MSRALDAVLPRHLAELRSATGLPVVFGGSTRPVQGALQLTISRTAGTYGDALRLVRVVTGRGLGGAAMERRTPCRVSDYASTPGITHDYDQAVVEDEQLASVMAYPVVVDGAVRGVLYGAARESSRIGDLAVRNAGIVAAHVARDVTALIGTPAAQGRVATALDELAELARSTADPRLRARLSRIHTELADAATPVQPVVGGPTLSPREAEALRLVAVGSTNAEVSAEMGIGVVTVKSYLHSAMRKLGVTNRGRAVVAARAAGLL
ncbi:helix-turn-helix transcriptional regulator [Pseudonocardia sp. KRD-169]|uniref:Helix-turn-helix transcriptional regulator n=2 Tax=Pseudonocardia abyssalis TaxID=2792008 RepID=A0ABS6UUF6_9PSEU|nr:helix-turn-helix transcriptional regulator [Pseudonocardia abyssalis]MBW0135893.1 helix-turn-helix transcriptional regulator [Pseudonocardia abyssalis]